MDSINEWEDETNHEIGSYKGFTYKIIRKPQKFLCGYAIAGFDTDFYKYFADKENYLKHHITVHGGIVSFEESDDALILGFDCAHPGDLIPYSPFTEGNAFKNDLPPKLRKKVDTCFDGTSEEYRNFDFVRNECKSMIDQMIGLTEAIQVYYQ